MVKDHHYVETLVQMEISIMSTGRLKIGHNNHLSNIAKTVEAEGPAKNDVIVDPKSLQY